MSGNESSETIFIRGISSHNGITTLLIGAAAVFLGGMTISLLPELFFLAGILIIAAGIIALTMGFFKIREPKYSLEITKERLTYHHRLGKWHIDWHNIQRVDVPRVHSGLEHIDLEMVGFRLKQPEAFLSTISPRLITHLLMEQRPLVTQAERASCGTGKCYGDDLIEDGKYQTTDGVELRGITAMFANRMRKLQSGLGYDVFISVNELDRSAQEFVNLVRDCHESVQQELNKAL
ncbi:DUF2982 domain-containing protein [Glaciecola sp. XM2]|jgi:hypothetical protein|uniref:DUF2982 domain-containing protein n=1 Tax=Glaciecola sp. XM2 TaxID=1914931 RepID=UPI001BDDF184|nr:DUF2982 domain-containing protein [Glaciecola sp. XM2]MBT1451622.1 DUF2982 domain-containing protein [Glaciecola sp. XM2]